MGLDLPFQFDLSQLDTDGIEDILADDERYRPFKITIDSDHAKFIEFGTNGHVGGGPSRMTAKGSVHPVEKKIREWVKARKGEQDDRLAHLIYKQIMEEGIPPQPFIRPGIHSTLAMIDTGMVDFGKMTTEDIAQLFIDNMERCLRDNRTLYGTEELLKSIDYEIVTPEEYRRLENESGLDGISDEIWASDEMDLNGNVDRTRMRKENIGNLRFR